MYYAVSSVPSSSSSGLKELFCLLRKHHQQTLPVLWNLTVHKRLSLTRLRASKFPMVLDRNFAEQYHKVTPSLPKMVIPKHILLLACVPLSVVSGNGSKNSCYSTWFLSIHLTNIYYIMLHHFLDVLQDKTK